MKKLIFILSITLFLNSCTKNQGKVLYNIRFSTDNISLKSSEINADNKYNQFGTYITSLTPTKFTSRIWTIGYIDKVLDRTNNNANMLQYIEQNSEKLSFTDPSRIVDFSNNTIVSFNPVIYGRVNNNNLFEDAEINFKYFYFIPMSFYQEVPLPIQYQNIHLNMFPGATITNNVLKVDHFEMVKQIFQNANVSNNTYFIFGNTDSTYVVNRNGEYVGFSEDCPIAEAGSSLTIRSDKYTNMIFNTPVDGGTVIMNGVLSFNTQDLIQVYAGVDNIPYTNDDVFVYAPRYWERINARLDVE